ncbi:MAG: ABC transporter ATP-binding protein [Pseudomonadota bacterium]
MSTPTLRIRQLVKRFGGILATDHVSLDIEANSIHALIGPNGAGKTTLVHQLAGTLMPDGGSIEFLGKNIARMPMHERVAQGIARSYQLTNIFSGYTVLHNVLLSVQARSGSSFRFFGSPFNEEELVSEATRIIAMVGLQGREQHLAKSLSYGEQRRIEIALALATRPRLLLLDEPLAGMGTADAEEIVHLIDGLKAQTTIVLIEHDMNAVFRLADKISVLVYGKVIATDAPAAIRASPAVRKAYLGDEEAQ